MRRAVTSLLASAALAASLGAAAPAAARECEGYGCAHENYERTRDLPAYGSRYDGYWDRRGEGRRDGRRHDRRHDRDHDHHPGVHYYPGYGYYADRDGWRDRRHGEGRADDCGGRDRSYDRSSGSYDSDDGGRRHCD